MKKSLYRKIIVCGILFVCISMTVMAQKATDILEQATATYEEANGIAATFALHTRMDGQGGESFEGAIQMKGDKFVLITPDMRIWYDGQTQWAYVERNEEVNVTTPTGDELQYTNPMVLLNSYKKGFNASLKGESTAASGRTAYDVELMPKKKGDIEKVTIQIEKLSKLPARISVQAKNGVYTTIQIDQLTTGQNQPDSFFIFPESDYPDAEIIDLR